MEELLIPHHLHLSSGAHSLGLRASSHSVSRSSSSVVDCVCSVNIFLSDSLSREGAGLPFHHVLLLLCVHERVCAAFKVSSNQSKSIIHWFISTLRASCGCRLPNCAFMFAADAPSPAMLLKRPAAAASACAYASAAADMCSLLVAAGYTPFCVRATGAIF